MYSISIDTLINDSRVAEMFAMSRSYVRKQRWLRRHGQPHFLTIDPVMIGSVPRYRMSDVVSFIEGLTVANDNQPSDDTEGDAS